MARSPQEIPEIPGYVIGSLLGRGGGGAVFRATQAGLERQVALKILPLSREGTDARQRRRFFREAKTLAQLEHPHLVKIYDFGGLEAVPFIAMELLTGGTLADRLRTRPVSREGGLPVEEVTGLGKDILSALVELHRARVIHRDIKPSNILYRDTGEAVLADFGIVKVLSPEATQMTGTMDIMGTMMYLPPEAYTTSNIGPPADIFSLGVVLFEALTGVHPTQGTPFGAGFKPPEIRSLCPNCPSHLEQLLLEMFDLEPDARPSALQALARLESPAAAAAAGRPPPTKITPMPRSRHRRALASLALLSGLAFAFLLARRPPSAPPVELELASSARSLRASIPAQTDPHYLGLFDAGGQLLQTLKGKAEKGRIVFEHTGLEPGTGYEARVLRLPASDTTGGLGECVGRRPFRTRSILEVLALDPGDGGPVLWAKGLPSLLVGAADDSAGVTVAAEPVPVRLGPVATRGEQKTARLSVIDGSGARSEVEVLWKGGERTDPSGRFEDLGVGFENGEIPGMGEAALREWLTASGIGWVASINSSSESTPVIRPEFFLDLQQKADIRSILDVRTYIHPEDATWESHFLALPWKKGAWPMLTTLQQPVGIMQRMGRGPMMAANDTNAWIDHVAARYPEIRFVAPPIPAMNVLQRMGGGMRFRMQRQAFSGIQSLALTAAAPPERWKQVSETVRSLALDTDTKLDIQWLWLIDSGRWIDLRQTTDPERAYLTTRLLFPRSKLIFDLRLLIDLESGKPLPSWAPLSRVVRRLHGLELESSLARDPTRSPHILGPESVVGLTFGGGGRKLHVVHATGGAGQVRFVPARPVKVSTMRAGSTGYADSVAMGPDPIELDVAAGPAYVEELTPVTCSGGGLTLEILHPFDGAARTPGREN